VATQSISREILFGTEQSARKLIESGANVNERDAWGFTPLIQATIMNKIAMAEFLLKHNAKIDQTDITGQTALQWAVNRRNRDLVQLFLEYKANPNHYSRDGQPVLVNPILRGEQDLIQLLLKAGADVTFPHDYINAKLIGHRYELQGKADIINAQGKFIELDFEGFYLEFSVGIILRTLMTFFNSKVGKAYPAYNTIIQKIIRTLKMASELVQYKYTKEGPKLYDAAIREGLKEDLVLVPVSYAGHAITFVKYKNFFAKCDRGVKEIVDTVVANHVGNPYALNADFLKDLMFNNKSDEYINTEIKKILRLSPFTTLPARYQLSGNCSWANVEASVPAMMLLLMFRGDVTARGEIAALKNSIMAYYDTWVEWDKDRVLDECIENFHEANRPRQASIATILGAILLQRCRPTEPKEVARARKIINILIIPEFNFILRNYINIYCTQAAGALGQDFTKLLKMLGLDFNSLTIQKRG
jgi:hypothetical protein